MLLNLRPCADCAQDEWRQIHIHNSASEFFLVYYRQLHTNVLNKCYLESLPLLVGGQDRSMDRQDGGEQDQCGVHDGARTAGVSLGSYFTLFIPFPMICSDVVLFALALIKQHKNIERNCKHVSDQMCDVNAGVIIFEIIINKINNNKINYYYTRSI